jgi:hypothetical protein
MITFHIGSRDIEDLKAMSSGCPTEVFNIIPLGNIIDHKKLSSPNTFRSKLSLQIPLDNFPIISRQSPLFLFSRHFHPDYTQQQINGGMAVVSLNLSFASPLFYFSLGIFLTLYVLMVLRKDQTKKISEFENNSIVKFYLNIFVQNKEEALSNVIKAKMANKFIAGPNFI